MMNRAFRTSVILILGGFLYLSGVSAHSDKSGLRQIRLSAELKQLSAEPSAQQKQTLAWHWQKVNSRIRQTLARAAQSGLTTESLSELDMSVYGDQYLQIKKGGDMRVTLRVSRVGPAERKELESLGYQITFESGEYLFLEGWLPYSRIEEAAKLDFVKAIQPTIGPATNTGSVTSEGDAILLASQARQTFGLTGSGVKVGVISDSIDGINDSKASGDLPANVQVLSPGQGAGEGTAMLEIVNDLAPGAPLAFYGPSSSGDMITGINQLAAAGSKVIVDDLTFFDQPHFEEGPLAITVNTVAAQGIVYLTSAGNFALGTGTDRSHYESNFIGSGSLGGPTTNVHDFGGGAQAQQITVRPNSRAVIFLQWANPFGLASDDYDLYVADGDGNIVAQSDDTQDGNDFPIEGVFVRNDTDAPVNYFVVIDLFSGVPRPIELYYTGVSTVQFATAAGSIAGHANASGAITVAAIGASDPGNDTIESFSSQGPCTLFFPFFENRQKPDVTGIDGVAVTGAAGFPNRFFGTSAAAPHIAAIAALMIQANPALNPSQVKNALQSTAIDFGFPGPDTLFGAGRVNALEAVRAVRAGGGNGTPPRINTLAARLAGDVLTLTGNSSDPDGDMTQVQVFLLDGAGITIAQTAPFAVGFGATTASNFTVQVSNLSAFPPALKAILVVIDNRANRSDGFTADFSQADAGGPTVKNITYAGTKMKIKGSGLSGQLQIEINGVIVAQGSNTSNGKVKIKGSAANLNLHAGLNRVRVIKGGLVSNISLLGL